MMVLVSKLLGPALSPIIIVCVLLLIAILAVRVRPRLARNAVAAAFLILFLASNAWVSSLAADYLESKNIPGGRLPNAQAIVVLSSDAKPAVPPQPAIALDQATANRLLYAAQLYRQGEAPAVILSGGRFSWQKKVPPISQGMAHVIEMMGVPKSAIILEAHSANTYQNAVDVSAILKTRHIGRVLLVTSAIHMPRALALFRHQGVDAIAAPCDFVSYEPDTDPRTGGWRAVLIGLVPKVDNLVTTSLATKELLGFAVYRAAGLL